jgi:hypothetical protein
MKTKHLLRTVAFALVSAFSLQPSALLSAAPAFEGRIHAELTRGSETTPLLYTVGTNQLRLEVTATNRPYPVDLVELSSGALTLVFPHNRSFVRLKPAAENASALPPGMPPMPVPAGIGPQSTPPPGAPQMPAPPAGMPPGIGPQAQATPGAAGMPAMPQMPAPAAGMPPGIGPQAQAPGASAMPAMPVMPMMPMPTEKMELKATGQQTNLLGYACERFELKQRGETLEIWATDKLFPFQPYQQNQPHRFRPRMLEEQWPGLLKARNLFPLHVSLRFESGPERLRFEVKSIKAAKITAAEGNLFQPPADYTELEPLPF